MPRRPANFASSGSKDLVETYYRGKCVTKDKGQSVFAGARGHVKNALAGQPRSTTLSDAIKQVERFRTARQTS